MATSDQVYAAWAKACTYRDDYWRGGYSPMFRRMKLAMEGGAWTSTSTPGTSGRNPADQFYDDLTVQQGLLDGMLNDVCDTLWDQYVLVRAREEAAAAAAAHQRLISQLSHLR